MAPFLFIACEKDNGQLGLNQVIDELAGLEKSSFPVISYTRPVDSVLVALPYDDQLSLGGYVGSRLAGSVVDPRFGKAEAGVVGQMILTQVNPDFGTNPVVDSVALYLAYSGHYGDTTKAMGLEVYELEEGLDRDSAFYSGFRPVAGNKIGEKLGFQPQPNSYIYTSSDTLAPRLKIDLDPAYFQSNFAALGNGSFQEFSNNEDFIEYFKGIYIKAAAGYDDGSILYFRLTSGNSRLVIYYHNDNETGQQVALNFAQDKSTVPINFSIFNQDYTTYPTAFDLNNPDSTDPGAQTTYIQSMGGVATVVKIPSIQPLLESNDVVVNRAFIEVLVEDQSTDIYAPSATLEIREMTENGPGAVIEDFQFGSSIGDGKLREDPEGNKKYLLEVTQHIFNVLNEGKNPNLAIVPVNKSTTANRTILKGGNDPVQPVKLLVYYTKP